MQPFTTANQARTGHQESEQMATKSRSAKQEVVKGPWSSQEDKILADYIILNGEGKWRDLPQKAGLNRCGKSCRLRWLNYLKPGVKRGKISADEEDLIIRMHKLIGNRWSLIAGRLPGRTDNEIKNYWNSNLSKRIHGNKISRSPKKRKLEQNQDQQKTDQSTHNECNTLKTETLPSSAVVKEVNESTNGLVESNDSDENTEAATGADPNASTDTKQKEVVEECDDNNYLINSGNRVNVLENMSLALADFPTPTPAEVTGTSRIFDPWDWSMFADPFHVHGEWDLHTVETFLNSEQNWIF